MNSEEALEWIEERVLARRGKCLSQAEKAVFQAAWEDKSYEEIAQNSSFKAIYLMCRVGPDLWRLLEIVLEEKKVGKKNIRAIIEQRLAPAVIQSSLNLLSIEKTIDPKPIEGQIPSKDKIFGRNEELKTLKRLIVCNPCVAIVGLPGIGKTALAAELVKQISIDSQVEFERFIWKSVDYSLNFEDLASDLFKTLTPLSEVNLPETIHAKISTLIKCLESCKCFVVLDGAEALLQGNRNNISNPYGEQRAEYALFFKRVVEELKGSCILLTTQELFSDLVRLKNSGRPFSSLQLEGLSLSDAMLFLRFKGLAGEESWERLIQNHLGNPLLLEQAADRIQELYDSDVNKYFKRGTSVIGLISSVMSDLVKEMLEKLFGNRGSLTSIEKRVMVYLAEELVKSRDGSLVFTNKLVSDLKLKANISSSEILAAVEDMKKRSLLEVKKSNNGGTSFSLKPMFRKYLIENKSDILSAAEDQSIIYFNA